MVFDIIADSEYFDGYVFAILPVIQYLDPIENCMVFLILYADKTALDIFPIIPYLDNV